MTTYEHKCNFCEEEFEAVYGMTVPPPTLCPLCNKEGGVERLISGGSGKGIMILRGEELKQKIKSETNVLRRDASQNERSYANLIGESKYHEQQLNKDSLTNDLLKIGKAASNVSNTKTANIKSKVRRSK